MPIMQANIAPEVSSMLQFKVLCMPCTHGEVAIIHKQREEIDR